MKVSDKPICESSGRLYRIWTAMKQRCYNPKNKGYANYGGKGIQVCDEWVSSYKSFKTWALLNGYNDNLSIDRKIHTSDYSPENCRWVTLEENIKEMCGRHKKNRTGGFSEESFRKIRIKNKENLGCKFDMYKEGELISSWGCLIDCAEFICKNKNLSTNPLQIKKNISACLLGKRGKCHGFTFKRKLNTNYKEF